MTSSGVGFAGPLRAGTEERWRRFLQDLTCSRREGYSDLLTRLGITQQRVWLVRVRGADLAVTYLECPEPRTVAARFAASTEPFDAWLKDQLADFHGYDLTRLGSRWAPELVFEAGKVWS